MKSENLTAFWRLNWLNIHLLGSLPMFLASNLVAICVYVWNMPNHIMPLGLGLIAGGLVDLDNRASGRIHNLFFTLLAFAVSSLSVQLTFEQFWLFLPLMTMLTFVLIMLGAIGQRYSTIAFGALLVAVYTAMTDSPETLWYENSALILLGALVYGVVSLLVHLCFPHRAMQENLAQFFEALADYLTAKSAFFDPDEERHADRQLALAKANTAVMASLDKARVSLFYRLQNRHSQQWLRYHFAGQDIWERASSSHSQYQSLFAPFQHSDLGFRFQKVLRGQADECRQIAASLRQQSPYQYQGRGEHALQRLQQSLLFHQQQRSMKLYKFQSIAENLQNIERQFVALSQNEMSKTSLKSTRLIAENVSGLRNMVQAVRSQCHFGSALFRHAVRLSVVVLVCSGIVSLFELEQGYWALLTAVLVCQPNYSATKKRLRQRVIGTLLGVFVGLSLNYLSPTLPAQLGIVVACCSLFYFFRTQNYGFSTFFITLQVLVSLEIVGLDPNGAMLPRILNTLIGAGVAWLAVSYLWSDWKYLRLDKALSDSLRQNAHYLRHILAQLQFGYQDHFAYRTARRSAHNSVATLSATVSNMLSEPYKYRQSLNTAPLLLGQISTLLSYISTLGIYRPQSGQFDRWVDFSAVFFSQGKRLAVLLDQLARGDTIPASAFEQIDHQLQQAEQQTLNEDQAQLLLQQLRLISQLLAQFHHNPQ